MAIAITGSTGFVGRHLVNKLLSETEHNLVLLVRTSSDVANFQENERISLFNVETDEISRLFCTYPEIEGVIHLATEYGRETGSTISVMMANLVYPISILESASAAGGKYFINTDSYFNKGTFAYSALLDYSLSKKSLKSWLPYFSNRVAVINVILEHVYGPGDSDSKFIQRMVNEISIMKSEKILLTGGEQIRDFIYVDDVADAFKTLSNLMKNHAPTFIEVQLGTGVGTTLRSILENIRDLSQSDSVLEFGRINYRSDEIMYSVADTSFSENFGWKPSYDLLQGLIKYLEYSRSQV